MHVASAFIVSFRMLFINHSQRENERSLAIHAHNPIVNLWVNTRLKCFLSNINSYSILVYACAIQLNCVQPTAWGKLRFTLLRIKDFFEQLPIAEHCRYTSRPKQTGSVTL